MGKIVLGETEGLSFRCHAQLRRLKVRYWSQAGLLTTSWRDFIQFETGNQLPELDVHLFNSDSESELVLSRDNEN
jgi:hypothetical protein